MGIRIKAPPSGATVTQNFQANGAEDSPYSDVSGVIKKIGATVTGTVVQQPSAANNGVWAISFSGVPLGSGYTLTVSAGANGTAQHTSITVNEGP